MFPGIRLGWAVGPADIAARLVSAKQNTDQCAGALGQRLFEECARRGWLDEQLALSRALYERKSRRLLAALERSMPEGARWTRPQGGFFSWLTLPDGADSVDLARRAVEQGVGIVPGTLFFPDGRGADTVRLSFSLVDEAQIDEGIDRLGVAPVSEATRYRWDDMPKEALKPDLARRLISTERMMLAHVYLDKGCIVPKHSHENEQLTYILEGVLRFRLGEDESEVVDVVGRRGAPPSLEPPAQRRGTGGHAGRRHLLPAAAGLARRV